MVRFKQFQFIEEEKFLCHCFLGESRKRMYIMTANENGDITGFKKFQKKKDEGYFLIYDTKRGE